jgi:hypothetical protein
MPELKVSNVRANEKAHPDLLMRKRSAHSFDNTE